MKKSRMYLIMLLPLTMALGLSSCNKDDDKVELQNVTLAYNTNGTTNGTTPDAVTEEKGTVIALENGTSFSRNGYTFAGWNT